MTHIRRTLLALTLAPVAFTQTGSPRERNLTDQFIDFVGPVPAASTPHPERFSEFVLATVGPVPLLGEAAGAGINHWMNTPKEWGQGWGAYGKRYGSNLGYNAIRQTITYAGSVALREDTRYFASNRSGAWARTRHALVSTVTARREDGRTTFSLSSTAGVIGASAISSVWGPPSWKGPGNIAANAGVSFASTAAFNVLREFLPDILRRPRK